MIPKYNKIHNRFKLNSVKCNAVGLNEIVCSLVKEGEQYEREIGKFLLDWQDTNPFMEAKTSGSTGLPKTIKLSKQAMVNSAIATGDFFKIKPGDKVLLCLPASYIAGKMMLVRAMVLGLELDLIKPKTVLDLNPNKQYHFAAMVPMQVQKNVKNIGNIINLIVGGAQVSNQLKEAIQSLNTKVYETYGMTETVSHIAVKPINNLHNSNTNSLVNQSFKTLPNIAISQDNRGCLVIEAPLIAEKTIVTNDVVKLHSDSSFEWIGRFDNVINSGGIKLFPEQIEAKLQGKINERFFITSDTDETLGERVILIIEANSNSLKSSVFEGLGAFERPKVIYAVENFVETTSGKVQRKKTMELVKK